MSVLSFNYSRSEGKSFGLLRLEDIVPEQVSTEPYKNNYGIRYKARTVVDCLNKGKQYRYPKGSTISNLGEWVSESLFD